MNRKSLSSRLDGFVAALDAGRRPEYARLHHEPLEDRRMLAAYINEIYWDPPSGGDAQFEYIELRGTAEMSLDDYYLIIVENEGAPMGNPGDIDMIFDLSGEAFGTNGFLTLRQQNDHPTNQYTVTGGTNDLVSSGAGFSSLATDDGNDGVIENSGGTFMLIKNNGGAPSVPTLAMDLDGGVNDGLDVATGHADWEIIDAIGVHAENGEAAGGRLYAQVNFGRGASSNLEPGAEYVNVDYELEYVGRWGDSTGQTAADWHASNLTDDLLSGFQNTGDFRQSGDSHGVGVTGRHIFYNQSNFDGNSAAAGPADSSAIATDKSAYVPGGGLIGTESITSYTRGINGIMVDFGPRLGQLVETNQGMAYGTNLTNTLGASNTNSTVNPDHRTITTDDFIFRMSETSSGANNSPSDWTAAPTPVINMLTNTPSTGTDRVEIIWANNAIQNRYLEVIVKGRDFLGDFQANAGLDESDVFFFGNRAADSGTGTLPGFFETSVLDAGQVFANLLGVAPIDNLRDYDRDGSVTVIDAGVVFANLGVLTRINIDIGGPFAPEAAPDDGAGGGSAIASALALPPSTAKADWGGNLVRVAPREPSAASIDRHFAQLANENDPRSRIKLSDEELGDVVGLDDELMDKLAIGTVTKN